MATAITPATSAEDYAEFGTLVREYLAALRFELDFQDVDAELADLAAAYGPPGGRALLAEEDGRVLGCVALRRFEPGVAELKRMYVRPVARGRGLGRRLGEAALEAAAELGYERVRLDTVAEMVGARRIYEALGFAEIAPYRHNPLAGARFYEVSCPPPPPPPPPSR